MLVALLPFALLSGCASSQTSYYEPTGVSGIGDVFEDIYEQIAESAWISR